ncbi:putative ferric-chelate reductase 1 homolog [Oppia nitens]|uniref:putative ferric-chelate reductase 1 homolog n=1 Tax=Oppia nitens TaxID=1686743 RepID=UPI0023D9F472|nr:putative ferric-chelate reductase 1 homolog [Oppia nitens]
MVNGYSHGAPTKSCQSLHPGHGVDKQYGLAPYELRVAHGPNGAVIVSLMSKGVGSSGGAGGNSIPFTGFMLQARLVSDRESIVNGRFSEDRQLSQTRNCNQDIPNTLTHKNGGTKYRVDTTWTAPQNFIGGVIFRATVVQTKSVFWTALDSQAVYITAPVVIQHTTSSTSSSSSSTTGKPNAAYNRQRDHQSEPKQPLPSVNNNNIQSLSTVPRTQASVDSAQYGSRIPYEVCSSKFCMGLPANCVRYRTCNMLLTGMYVMRGDGMVEFEIHADVNKYNANSYYSMGLSTDNKMGEDSVTDCMISDGRPVLRNSVNIGRNNEYLSANEYHSVTVLNTTYNNGLLYCKWRRRRRSTIRGVQYDLKDKQYYLLLAYGLLAGKEDTKDYHTERLATDQTIDMRIVGQLSAAQQSTSFLIKLHGSFMVFAWLGCVSIAIFIARYFKDFWPNDQLFGVKIWFAAHRSLMLSALILILLSSVSIWIHVGTFTMGPHQWFGLASIVIIILNPIGALFRPKPESPKRWIFNWLHFLLGNTGHISAIVALVLAYYLPALQMSQIYLWILIIYILFHVTSHLIMQMYMCDFTRKSKTSDISMQDVPHLKTNNNINNNNNNNFKTKNSLIQLCLMFYIIAVVVLIIGLIVCIYIPQSAVNYVKS